MEKNTRFSIRKLGVCVASVAVASFFACGTASAHNLEALTSGKANPELPFAHVPIKIEFTQAESPWMPTTTQESDNNSIEYTGAERPFAGRELPTAPVDANYNNPGAPFAQLDPSSSSDNQNQEDSIPWIVLTPAEEITDDQEKDPSSKEESTPLVPLEPAKEVTPWTELTPATPIEEESTPLIPLEPAKKVTPWVELTPATPIEKESTPLIPLEPAKKVTPWVELTPATPIEKESTPLIPLELAKEVTPWTELTPAQPVKDNSEPNQEQENPTDQEKESIPWTELTPAQPIKDNLESDQEQENPKGPEPGTENSLDSAQTQMLKLINDFRRVNNSPEITYNPSVQPGTNLRAEEIATEFAHVRPNGDAWYTAFTKEELGLAYGENIVSIPKNYINGPITEPENMNDLLNIFFIEWQNSPGHRENMLKPDFTTVTFSIFEDDNWYCGVQIFTTPIP